jgi:hypothetical protein
MGLSKLKLDPKVSGLGSFVKKPDEYKMYDVPGVVEGDVNKIEPEDKWMIPDHYDDSVFQTIHDLFASPSFPKVSSIHGTPVGFDNNIFLSDSVVKTRAPLFSLSKDTVDDHGVPTYLITASGEQFRNRGPLIVELDEDGFEVMMLPRGQATIKSLQSGLAEGESRRERETSPSADFLMASQNYLDSHRHLLPPVFQKINEENLRVSGICLVPRASFNVTVFVPKYGAFVEFEVCADPCTHLTPNGDMIVGQDREIEYETKAIFLTKDTVASEAFLDTIVKDARKMMAQKILSAFPDFEVAKYSKMERANIAVAQFYNNNRTGFLRGSAKRGFQVFSTIMHLRSHYDCLELRRGMVTALEQNVSEKDIVLKKLPAIMAILKQLPKAEDLIPLTKDSRHTLDTFVETTPESRKTAYRCRSAVLG